MIGLQVFKLMKVSRLYITLFLLSFFGCTCEKESTSQFQETEAPLINVFFGDPSIMESDGTYYLYGTGPHSDTGIQVYQSTDLVNWEGPVGATNGFALHENDVIGDKQYWAPEVYELDGTFYMFFSVQEHLGLATSTSPKGPFTQQEQKYMAEYNAIDHHLFIDDDGTKYIYFVRFTNGNEIWVGELTDELTIKEETLRPILHQSQEWEKSPKDPVGVVNEGPTVVKHEGLYYMVYSANHFASPDYGLGLAYADNPLGPWIKDETNPFLQNPEGITGTGHSAFFTDKDENLYMVYHAHNSYEGVQPRKVFYNPIEFIPVDGENRYRVQLTEPRVEVLAKQVN